MASLKKLLAFTAFFKFNGVVHEHEPGESIDVRNSTWDWSFDASEGPEIRNLCCRTDAGERPCVLERVQWRNPAVNTDFVQSLNLPLRREFILKTYSSIGGSGGYDPDLLDDRSESSLQVVYGFQYSHADQTVKPLTGPDAEADPDFDSEDFLSDFMADPPEFEPREVGSGERIRVYLRPVKFLFVVELICCEVDNRFEPTGAGRVARFFPRSYLLANVPCSVRDATTRLLRCEHAQHCDHGQHGVPAEAQDGATHEYHSGLYADSNHAPILKSNIPPKWPHFFNYYSFDDRRRYHVVKSRATGERQDSSSLMRFTKNPVDPFEPVLVVKVPRQGAFDNVHIAPAMIAPEVIRRKRQEGPDGAHWHTLEKIMMAPVCHHDCFHMHWRWGAGLHQFEELRYLKGWNAEGAYREIGAPMIPPNQDLYIQCPQSHEVLYTVEVEDLAPAMRWQVFLDHGAGYIVGMEDQFSLFDFTRVAAEVVLKGTNIGTMDVEPSVNLKSWAMFYWNMRYVNLAPFNWDTLAPLERLQFNDGQLQALADL